MKGVMQYTIRIQEVIEYIEKRYIISPRHSRSRIIVNWSLNKNTMLLMKLCTVFTKVYC